MNDISSIAKQLVEKPKGILAADESNGTADKRLASYGIDQSAEMRRQYRELFLAMPGAEEYLSGVILYSETLTQADNNGVPFAKLLADKGILPGIKVDEGTEAIPESPDELITKGLIGLPERLAAFVADHGTAFTKWRAVIKIDGDKLPTSGAIVENAKRLATYSRMVQEAGMVPIVEPEVLYDGTHSRLRCREVVTDVTKTLMAALIDQAVDLSAVILKSSMVLSGKDTGRIDTPEEVAEDTLGALMDSVPKELAGIVFLSGGQGTEQAAKNLAAINALAKEKGAPWNLSFSFARSLQGDPLAAWGGKAEQVEAARAVFLERIQAVSNAVRA